MQERRGEVGRVGEEGTSSRPPSWSVYEAACNRHPTYFLARRERADDGDKEARTRALQSAVVFDFELVHGTLALTIPK